MLGQLGRPSHRRGEGGTRGWFSVARFAARRDLQQVRYCAVDEGLAYVYTRGRRRRPRLGGSGLN
jgi:hypothetical protein